MKAAGDGTQILLLAFRVIPTVPTSAWPGGALQPAIPGLKHCVSPGWQQPAGVLDAWTVIWDEKREKKAASSGNPGKAKPCYLGRETGFARPRHPPYTPSPLILSPPLLYIAFDRSHAEGSEPGTAARPHEVSCLSLSPLVNSARKRAEVGAGGWTDGGAGTHSRHKRFQPVPRLCPCPCEGMSHKQTNKSRFPVSESFGNTPLEDRQQGRLLKKLEEILEREPKKTEDYL